MSKYNIHKFSLIIIDEIIQPKLLIEEKAIIFRREVWFNPPRAPINILRIIEKINKFILK